MAGVQCLEFWSLVASLPSRDACWRGCRLIEGFCPIPYLLPVSTLRQAFARFELTITKNSMQLILRQESQPVDTILLVLAQLRVDLDGDVVLFNFTAI